MNPVKHFLQNIVSGKFDDEKEAKEMYINNVYKGEQKIRRLDSKTDCNKDMIDIYDQVRKALLFLHNLISIMYQLMINQMIKQIMNN